MASWSRRRPALARRSSASSPCTWHCSTGQKCFYTTPIKALSNQKFSDLVARHGAHRVGLLTGDTSINGDADVVVMTTEVLRNMLYSRSDALRGLGHVVMDEVHYLADRSRGAVWEEVIIHLPEHVAVTSLSATVSNAEEFGDWLVTVRGNTEVVVEEHRPVPLFQHVMLGDRMYDLFEGPEGDVNPVLVRKVRENEGPRIRERGQRPPRPPVPRRPDVLLRLDREGLLPAITFIFSRAGCAAAVEQCLRAGLRLNTDEERIRVRQHVQQRTRDLPRDDLRVLGYWEWLEGLERGLAAHHAGMLPTFKEVVEELFVEGLVKAVFATETLALGINMPARSVVLEKLVKWNGDAHVEVTPGEYTQLTGRAGRRGIDIEGHAVVLWQPGLDPRQVAGLASTRTYPLRSSFRPSYNMAVNLVGTVGREPARALLESSFAQFQADRSVVGLARQVSRNLEALDGYREGMTCPLGDVVEYDAIRQAVRKRESELAEPGLRAAPSPGLELAGAAQGRRRDRRPAGPALRAGGGHRPGRWASRGRRTRWSSRWTAGPAGCPTPTSPHRWSRWGGSGSRRASTTAVPRLARTWRRHCVRSASSRPDRGARRAAAADDEKLAGLRAAAAPAPRARLRRPRAAPALGRALEPAAARHRQARATGRGQDPLDRPGLRPGLPGARGARLPRRRGGHRRRPAAGPGLQRVRPAGRGVPARRACGTACPPPSSPRSCRRSSSRAAGRRTAHPPSPVARCKTALDEMARLWGDLRDVEARHGLAFLREPDAGFAWASWRWAAGAELEQVLQDDPDLTPGDFVRWCKQLVDVLGHIATIAEDPVRSTARASLSAVRRGVVTYSSVS